MSQRKQLSDGWETLISLNAMSKGGTTMDRKWFLVIPVILVVALLIGFLVGSTPARSDSQIPDTIEKGHRLLSRQEQINLMVECWEDARLLGNRKWRMLQTSGSAMNVPEAIFAAAFFEYRAGE